MYLIKYIIKKHLKMFFSLLGGGIIPGVLQISVFIMLNTIISKIVNNESLTYNLFLVTLLLITILLLFSRFFSSLSVKISFKIIHIIRMDIINAILKMNFADLNQKKDHLNSLVIKDAESISQTTLSLIPLISSIIIAIGCLIYLFSLSFTIFMYMIITPIIGFGLYLFFSRKSLKKIEVARKHEDHLFFNISQIINGFKEIKINPRIGVSILNGPLVDASKKYSIFSIKGFVGYFNCNFISQAIFYLAITLLLFTGNVFLNIDNAKLISCFIVILFLISPLGSIVSIIPNIARGNIAIKRIDDFLSLSHSIDPNESNEDLIRLNSKLIYDSLTYQYKTESTPFIVGPLNFEIEKGKIHFVYGSNGSGKTTLLYLIIGLINHDKCNIIIDDSKIDKSPSQLFSPVFSDFYLFDRIYETDNIDIEKVNHYLKIFELEKKVRFEIDRFTSINLSYGQRKRLALISALLEKREILVLDEWAADQDPLFRRKFYKEILPLLKAEGFTIFAITHDDKYFNCSDFLYYMDAGSILKIK